MIECLPTLKEVPERSQAVCAGRRGRRVPSRRHRLRRGRVWLDAFYILGPRGYLPRNPLAQVKTRPHDVFAFRNG